MSIGAQSSYSAPYTPQHNARIEIFLKTLDRRITKAGVKPRQLDYKQIDKVVFAYNNLHNHKALQRYGYNTPADAYAGLERWSPGQPIQLIPRDDIINNGHDVVNTVNE
ncbi:Integrase_core domain-containing protein [Hexamita inflata]|uniref:Integrase_core domain-containing protein n=1 Tax=Hexamita inflata TaxID=28002 RepID=A0ABP1J4P1_9EUKA